MERSRIQREQAGGQQAPRLAGEQASLARVVLGEADYLLRSPAEEGLPRSLEGSEVSLFLNFWRSAPLGCIRAMNQGIGRLKDPSWIRRYVEAAVDLEILMDRTLGPGAEAAQPCPVYLPDGYTAMLGLTAGEREGEGIGVDKERVRSRLVESKEQALAVAAIEKLLAAYYDAVIQDLERDPGSVQQPGFDPDGERISVSLYLQEGVALSRRMAIRYQLCLQEAGVASIVVEGKLKLFGKKIRHAWNLAWFDRQVALVDVALPGIECPLILLGESPDDLYGQATQCHRLYLPGTDSVHSCAVAVSAEQPAH